jgi:hypothetical protein
MKLDERNLFLLVWRLAQERASMELPRSLLIRRRKLRKETRKKNLV